VLEIFEQVMGRSSSFLPQRERHSVKRGLATDWIHFNSVRDSRIRTESTAIGESYKNVLEDTIVESKADRFLEKPGFARRP